MVVDVVELHEYPEGEVDTAETIDLTTARTYATTSTIRTVHDSVDEADPTSADLLHGMLERLEQLTRMVSAENLVANQTQPTPIHE